MRFKSWFLCLAAAFTLASCSLFETTVDRDLRAVWSPDGASVLIVRSEYTTTNPGEPYFAASPPTAHDWQILLDEADGTSADPLSTRHSMDQFAEEYGQQGAPQQDPVYWFPAAKRAFFGGRSAYVRFVDQKSTWYVPTPRTEIETALGTVNEVDPTLTAHLVAQDMGIQDLVPSPDGNTAASLYQITYEDGPEIGGALYEYRVVAFWDVATRQLARAVRVTPEVWHSNTIKGTNAYPELTGDDQNYTTMAWARDGSGVYAYVYKGTDNNGTDVPSIVAFVPVTGAAATATLVPDRPIATASGPVSPSGLGFYLSINGNETTLMTKSISGWVPFDQNPLVSASSWLAGSSVYNF